ncbi:hypothetical protein ACNO5M_27430, partial [Vibrio owensii]|uniref:hypothetical protein n=1 Tax=Vibrio owensii TaxID=696485 RepID=UPI003AB02DA4
DKALAEMLGLFRLRYYLVYDQRVPLVCKPSRSTIYLETQSSDWVLSFKSKEIFPFQGMRASCPQTRTTRHPYHSATYTETQPLD